MSDNVIQFPYKMRRTDKPVPRVCELAAEQFEQIIDIIIVYKHANPKKNVYLNEKCAKDALNFMNTTGKQFASQLGLNNSDDDD